MWKILIKTLIPLTAYWIGYIFTTQIYDAAEKGEKLLEQKNMKRSNVIEFKK